MSSAGLLGSGGRHRRALSDGSELVDLAKVRAEIKQGSSPRVGVLERTDRRRKPQSPARELVVNEPLEGSL